MTITLESPAAELQPYPLTVQDFLRLCDADPVRFEHFELVNGRMYAPMAESAIHAEMIMKVFMALDRDRATGERVFAAGSVKLAGDGMPEPDVFVLKSDAQPGSDGYWDGSQLSLAVEVSRTPSRWRFDTTEKAVNYARGGVPSYYVVNIVGDETFVRCFTRTRDGEYHSMNDAPIEYLLGDSIP